MKKRTLLLPLSAFLILSCTKNPADVRNKYSSSNDCDRDNPREEVKKNYDDDDGFDGSKLCERVEHGGTVYYLGPAYPYGYYGHYGYYQGYWMGRSSAYSGGVVHESGQSFTHSEIAARGGISNTVSAARASSSGISRGGFGSHGSSAVGG